MKTINCYFCNLPNEDPGSGIIKCETCSNEYQQVYTGSETTQIYTGNYHVILRIKSFCTHVYDIRNDQKIIIPGLDLHLPNLLEKVKTFMLLS